jgi:hypothetical protein
MFAIALLLLVAADDTGGWPDLFPTLGNFDRKVAAPVVARGEKPAVYSQATTYEWLGGRFEVITITLARDPAFKKKYAAATIQQTKPIPEVLKLNEKTAYLWDYMKPEELEKVNRRLVVVLADDRVIVIEQRGAGLELPDVAKKLDFAKVVKALESPPAKK